MIPKLTVWHKTKKVNREKIIKAAKQVFAEIGYDAATIRDIVRESGLSVGSFYNYFTSKKEIFKVIIDDIIRNVRLRLQNSRAQAETGYSFIADAYLAFFEECSKDQQILRIIARNQVQFRAQVFQSKDITGLFSELESDLKMAVEKKIFPRIPVELVTWAMIGAGMEILIRLLDHKDMDIESASDFLAKIFLGGFEKLNES